jgi:hypothetical protein
MAFRTPSLISFTFQVGCLLRRWGQLHPGGIQEDPAQLLEVIPASSSCEVVRLYRPNIGSTLNQIFPIQRLPQALKSADGRFCIPP